MNFESHSKEKSSTDSKKNCSVCEKNCPICGSQMVLVYGDWHCEEYYNHQDILDGNGLYGILK